MTAPTILQRALAAWRSRVRAWSPFSSIVEDDMDVLIDRKILDLVEKEAAATGAEAEYGPLVPLVREDVVAAREAAAYARGAEEALRDAAHVLAYASDVWREDGGSPRHRFAYWEAARLIGAWAEKPSRMEGPLRGAKKRGAQIPGPLDKYPPAPRAAAVVEPDTAERDTQELRP